VIAVRTQLAVHLRENLKTLGLQRRVKAVTITDLLTQTANEKKPFPTTTATGKTMGRINARSCVRKSGSTRNGHSCTCLNPFCASVIEHCPMADGAEQNDATAQTRASSMFAHFAVSARSSASTALLTSVVPWSGYDNTIAGLQRGKPLFRSRDRLQALFDLLLHGKK
jgi:hypothetical protein